MIDMKLVFTLAKALDKYKKSYSYNRSEYACALMGAFEDVDPGPYRGALASLMNIEKLIYRAVGETEDESVRRYLCKAHEENATLVADAILCLAEPKVDEQAENDNAISAAVKEAPFS